MQGEGVSILEFLEDDKLRGGGVLGGALLVQLVAKGAGLVCLDVVGDAAEDFLDLCVWSEPSQASRCWNRVC